MVEMAHIDRCQHQHLVRTLAIPMSSATDPGRIPPTCYRDGHNGMRSRRRRRSYGRLPGAASVISFPRAAAGGGDVVKLNAEANTSTPRPLCPGVVHAGARPFRHSGLGQSAARTLEGDQDPLNTTWPDPSLHLDRGDGLELPTIAGMIIENSLQLVPGHLASDQALANLDYLVLITG
jgi:hypothetical protein